MSKFLKYIISFSIVSGFFYLLSSCANIASPTGGLYDETPPRMLKSNPKNGSLNVKRKIIEIEFDENIKIEKPAEKVIITPPQISLPVIKSVGKKAVVELEDDLLENTTYTIDFTDAIVDNNEGNPLENFSLSFSTGDVLDTLAVSGVVLSASNLEPSQGIYVGMHSSLEDTAFTKVPFEKISRTDSRGRFTVRGIAPGEYKIFALKDDNRDYIYSSPLETIAFLDSIIVPSSMPAVRQDTVFLDSITVDSIKIVDYTRFMPDDIVLRTFDSGFKRKYREKHERSIREKLMVYFSAPTKTPSFELISPQSDNLSWYVMERSRENDTISLWITDSLISKQDTILLKMDYLKTDTINRDVLESDTLRFMFKEQRVSRKEKKKEKAGDEEEEIRYLSVTSTIKTAHEVYAPIYINFEHPVIDFDSSKVILEHEKDSVFITVPFSFSADSINPRQYKMEYKWEPGEKYKLRIDSAMVHSVYGLFNEKTEQAFSVKSLDQYGNLLFVLHGLPDSVDAYVELLDSSDKPFRKVRVKNNEALIFDIDPGKIFARLFIDDNGDGEWTTGSYNEKRQPEKVFYYPKALEIRAYTDHEEDWDLMALPIDKQKPVDILKNKPEEKKKRNLNEERGRQQGQQRGQQQRGTGTSQRMGAGSLGI